MKKRARYKNLVIFELVLTDPGKELIPSLWTILSRIELQRREPAQNR